ncbi:hypothetical protein BJ912DRAFT_624984 [Pholiota molesta]|nr:hypothetical protein BJ912DRAFT_624984 [Pholiota molesta]
MRFVSLSRLPCLAATYASSSRMFFRNLALFFVVADCLLLPSIGQTNHAVTVGELGSFYSPLTLAAGINDTVTFVFEGPFHTVTQSSLANPCVPLPGGFNSGVLGRGTNDSTTPSPTWTILITNISEPIWYFCEISTPTSHCESGMVGAINPPSQEVFQQFRSAAEAVTGTPAPSPTLVLSGIGAVASQGPVTPSSSTSQSTPTSHLGTIIGAAVGGALGAILIIAAITWWLVQRKARNVADSPTSDDSHFFQYNPAPVRVRRPSEAFVAAKAMENSMVTAFPLPPDSAAPLAPNRRASTSPGNVMPPAGIPRKNSDQALERQPSLQSTLASPGMMEQTSNVDMRALATQVAAVLRNSPSGGTLSTTTNTTGSLLSPTASSMQHQAFRADKRLGLHTADQSHSSQDPPAYRAAMGTPAQDVLKPNRA